MMVLLTNRRFTWNVRRGGGQSHLVAVQARPLKRDLTCGKETCAATQHTIHGMPQAIMLLAVLSGHPAAIVEGTVRIGVHLRHVVSGQMLQPVLGPRLLVTSLGRTSGLKVLIHGLKTRSFLAWQIIQECPRYHPLLSAKDQSILGDTIARMALPVKVAVLQEAQSRDLVLERRVYLIMMDP